MKALVPGVLYGLLLIMALCSPLPMGSVNTEWSMPLAAMCMLLGVGMLAVAIVRDGRRAWTPVLLPLALFVLWSAVQLVPLPMTVVALVSPGRAAIVPAGGEVGFATLSAYPGVTFETLLLHFGLLLLLAGLATMPSRAPFRILAIAGSLHAVLAVVLLETRGTDSLHVFWLYDLPEVLTPFGTFVNKNHFGGFMIICSGAALGVLFRRWGHALSRVEDLGWRGRFTALTGRGSFRLFGPGIGLLLMLLTIFASGSRGAALAMGLALVVVPPLFSRGRGLRKLWPVAATVVLICGAAFAATLGRSTSVLERLSPEGNYLNRPRLWKESLRMTTEFPVSGVGLGAFYYVFPRYQSFAPDREFTHAEGDWIQTIAETGVVGAGALLLFGILLLRRIIRHLRLSGRNRRLLAGGVIGLVGIWLHGFLDISLHMPSNMFAATLLLGGLISCSASPRGRDGELVRRELESD